MNIPPAMRLTVSKTCNDRICRMTLARSKRPGVSLALLQRQRTKCGRAWTSVLSKLSNLVWKSWVSVDTGSSPFSL